MARNRMFNNLTTFESHPIVLPEPFQQAARRDDEEIPPNTIAQTKCQTQPAGIELISFRCR